VENKEFFTVPETMKLLGVKRTTIYKYRREGILECHKPAGLLYITWESINRFLYKDKQASQKIP
jgi:predicted site-specific integrase-resolvase